MSISRQNSPIPEPASQALEEVEPFPSQTGLPQVDSSTISQLTSSPSLLDIGPRPAASFEPSQIQQLLDNDPDFAEYQSDRAARLSGQPPERSDVSLENLPDVEDMETRIDQNRERINGLVRTLRSVEQQLTSVDDPASQQLAASMNEQLNSLMLLAWGLDDIRHLYPTASSEERLELVAELSLTNRATSAILRQIDASTDAFANGAIPASDRARIDRIMNLASSEQTLTLNGLRFALSEEEQASRGVSQAERIGLLYSELMEQLPPSMRETLQQNQERLLITIDEQALPSSERAFATNITVRTSPLQHVISYNPERLAEFDDARLTETIANELWDVWGKMIETDSEFRGRPLVSTVQYQTLGIVFDGIISEGGLTREEMAQHLASVAAAYVAQDGVARDELDSEQSARLDQLTRMVTGGEFDSFEQLWREAIPYFDQSL